MTMLIKVPTEFQGHAAAAALRFGYLHPHLICTVQESGDIEVGPAEERAPAPAHDAAAVRRDLLHLLYREKVYVDMLDLRRALYDGCMR